MSRAARSGSVAANASAIRARGPPGLALEEIVSVLGLTGAAITDPERDDMLALARRVIRVLTEGQSPPGIVSVPTQCTVALLVELIGTPEKVICAENVLEPARRQTNSTGTDTVAPTGTAPGSGVSSFTGPDRNASWGNHCGVHASVPALRTVTRPVRVCASSPSMP